MWLTDIVVHRSPRPTNLHFKFVLSNCNGDLEPLSLKFIVNCQELNPVRLISICNLDRSNRLTSLFDNIVDAPVVRKSSGQVFEYQLQLLQVYLDTCLPEDCSIWLIDLDPDGLNNILIKIVWQDLLDSIVVLIRHIVKSSSIQISTFHSLLDNVSQTGGYMNISDSNSSRSDWFVRLVCLISLSTGNSLFPCIYSRVDPFWMCQ